MRYGRERTHSGMLEMRSKEQEGVEFEIPRREDEQWNVSNEK